MKRFNLLIFTAALLLLGSCSNDEETQEPVVKKFAPKVTASINGITEIKAGVIENNDDYARIGEQFYWSIGDASTLFFNEDRLNYVVDAVEMQRNKASFSTSDVLPNGQGKYDITGYFPTSQWNFDNLTVSIPTQQSQMNNTSKHLLVPMKGQLKNVQVDSKNAVELNYKHLGAVLRFVVWNRSGRNLRVSRIEIENLNIPGDNPLFNVEGRLANKDATSLILSSNRTSKLTLDLLAPAGNFENRDGKDLCDAYMTLLPSQPFTESDGLLVTVYALENETIPASSFVFFDVNSLPILTKGFEQGKSYYFKLTID